MVFCCIKNKFKKNTIHPEDVNETEKKKPKKERRMDMTVEELNNFNREVIYCGGCKQPFNLGSNELKTHCNGCNKFFHCKIAGKCRGIDCSYNGHTASYCFDCVKITYDNGLCLCKDCYNISSSGSSRRRLHRPGGRYRAVK